MSWEGMGNAGDYEQVRDDAVEGDAAARMADPCMLLEEEIEELKEQIVLLEEGLPRAPGMERAALFKELAAYRRELDAHRLALRQCRDATAAQQRSLNETAGGDDSIAR